MFSRFRMSPIVDIQGVRLGLAAADSGLRYDAALVVVVEGGERGRKNTHEFELRELEVTYRRTVQDRRRLPPLDSASSLQRKNTKHSTENKMESLSFFSKGFKIQFGLVPFV